MKQIQLTQGKVTLVDDVDFESLNQFKWCAWRDLSGNFYAARNSSRKDGKRHTIFMHRQLLGLEFGDKREADHKDHQTLNNRRDNLRICTHQQNMLNQKSTRNSSSQFKGVCWHKQLKKWCAQIRIDGKLTHLGYYDDEEMAALAYNVAAKKYFGNFAYLNKIP